MVRMKKLVFFDIANTLVEDDKDISEYVSESIRNIYGRVVDVNLSKYMGQSAQNIAEAILNDDGMDRDEIESKLLRYLEDLFYTYYNVAGHDREVLLNGARELLGSLWKDDVSIGILTGEVERIARFRTEKVGIHGFFKIGAFGNDGRTPEDIVDVAINRGNSEYKVDKHEMLVVTNSPYFIKAAKRKELSVVGVANRRYSIGELRISGADVVVSSVKERKRILEYVTK